MKNIIKKYKGMWISVSKDYRKVYAFSKNLHQLVDKVNKKKKPDGLIMKVPARPYSIYVG